ncbi:phytase [candidate division KSB1 bacterium]|nr:phytase [candidate division KSB1 bacterium]
MQRLWFFYVLIMAITLSQAQQPDTLIISTPYKTSSVETKADHVALWIHPVDPQKSMLIGTDKGTYPSGGLYIWNLDGELLQKIDISHPNAVDVEYGLQTVNGRIDIAVVTMRDHAHIRVYKIDPEQQTLQELTTDSRISTFEDPYGLTLFKRNRDGEIFALVSSKNEKHIGEIRQYRLFDNGTGTIKGTLVRAFGNHSGIVEGMIADDEMGYYYAVEDNAGVHKYYADPEKGDEELAFFATREEFGLFSESIAIYTCSDTSGYLLITNENDQLIRMFTREGTASNPHDHRFLGFIAGTKNHNGDDIFATQVYLGPRFPNGALLWHDDEEKNIFLYDWRGIANETTKYCSRVRTDVKKTDIALPETIELMQNFPNPFNPVTRIQFNLSVPQDITLGIYDLNGKEVNTLINDFFTSGSHQVEWTGLDQKGIPVASGVYLYQLNAKNMTISKTMILIR